jgi:crossover junction endodeoxyribonuclease RuvC
MLHILGIDPGSVCTGYGVISLEGNHSRCVTYGQIRSKHKNLPQKLQDIYQGIQDIIAEYHPDEAAIEEVFMSNNAQSALKLGQARGVAVLAAAMQVPIIAEYSPREIKLAVVGYGAAGKPQVQSMVSALLQLKETPPADAADALAIALCHAHSRRYTQQLQQNSKESV